jgi:putative holliday junction resolvase
MTVNSGRILAIDLGRKRVGLAVSDPLGHFAVGLETVTRTAKTDLVGEIGKVCQQYGVSQLVLGLPVNMDGSEGPKALESRQLAEALEARLKLPVALLDERLTSVIAQQTLKAQGISPSRHKGWVDETAAKILLQDYLARRPIQED